jgi:hypothetical protein
MVNVWRADPVDSHKFHQARTGNHLMVAFECDLCVFRKLYKCNPIQTQEEAVHAAITPEVYKERTGSYPVLNQENDQRVAATICRMILDVFWSQASSMVCSNAKIIQKGCELSKSMGLDPPYLEPGPLLPFDHCGYGVAIHMLFLASQEPGRHSTFYKQFDMIRRLLMGFGNQIRASAPQANMLVTAIGDADGKTYQ